VGGGGVCSPITDTPSYGVATRSDIVSAIDGPSVGPPSAPKSTARTRVQPWWLASAMLKLFEPSERGVSDEFSIPRLAEQLAMVNAGVWR
jgi:hypothetical protein